MEASVPEGTRQVESAQISGKVFRFLSTMHPSLGKPERRRYAEFDPDKWYPWTPETLARARREQKPIFLSIGYSTCHWCHVMQAESFRDPEIAELLNQNFLDPLENLFTRRCHDTSLFGIDVGLLQRGDHTPVSRTFSVDPVRPGRSGRPSARNSTTRFSTPRLARAIALAIARRLELPCAITASPFKPTRYAPP